MLKFKIMERKRSSMFVCRNENENAQTQLPRTYEHFAIRNERTNGRTEQRLKHTIITSSL